MTQQAVLIVFEPETTAGQVKEIVQDLQNELNCDRHILDPVQGARISQYQIREFDPEYGGVVIYQP